MRTGLCSPASFSRPGLGSLARLKDTSNATSGSPQGSGRWGSWGRRPRAQISMGSQPARPSLQPRRGGRGRGSGTHAIRQQSAPGCGSKCHLYCREDGGAGGWNGRGRGGQGSRSVGAALTGEKEARPGPGPSNVPVGPVLGRAQDSLQVLGQGADGCLYVQLCPLQHLLLHRELVALCPHLQGQRWSGAGALPVWQAPAGQGRELSHQLLPKFQDQIHHLHLGLVLHPGLDVLP